MPSNATITECEERDERRRVEKIAKAKGMTSAEVVYCERVEKDYWAGKEVYERRIEEERLISVYQQYRHAEQVVERYYVRRPEIPLTTFLLPLKK